MNPARTDNIISFVTGDLLAMLAMWLHVNYEWLALKILMVMLFGFLGGAAGLAGKDCYQFMKQKIKQFFK